ncbi:ethylene-responsive transcription factor erf024 [Phtheirospermum japonicum]|uniref:Ethylene-responsive transcription factor erf024 n=1 Tax=Phtheirospermum japonicum TaxID=374723 RepID=A0A830C1F3_9LAMI|nr:ethylene-responsive transcription factor erf024 [Phtheirospermum japonicum]
MDTLIYPDVLLIHARAINKSEINLKCRSPLQATAAAAVFLRPATAAAATPSTVAFAAGRAAGNGSPRSVSRGRRIGYGWARSRPRRWRRWPMTWRRWLSRAERPSSISRTRLRPCRCRLRVPRGTSRWRLPVRRRLLGPPGMR